MISTIELYKATKICPSYLVELFNSCMEFSREATNIQGMGEFATEYEIGKLYRLGQIVLEDYLALVNQIKFNEADLIKQIRNDTFSAFSMFYTKSQTGFVRVNWDSLLKETKISIKTQEVISSIMAFIESKIYLPFTQTYEKVMSEQSFLNMMINLSTRRSGFFPELEKKPKVEDLFGGGGDEEKPKKSKKEKDG